MADARQLLHRETKTDGPFQKTTEIYAPDAPKPTPPQEQDRRAAQQNLYTQQESYPEFMQRRAQEASVRADMAREAKLGAQDPLAYAARQVLGPLTDADRMFGVTQHDGPHSAMLGSIPALMAAQILHAPGKMFSRAEIVAIIRAHKTSPMSSDARSELNRLQSTFENLE